VPKSSFAAKAIACVLLYGIVPCLFGFFVLREWRAEGVTLVVAAVAIFLSGATMVACALWILVLWNRQRLLLRIGGLASIVAGCVLIGASYANVLPCSGPE
jgi:hypothetical protein